jgi:hypothetical protein
MGRSSRFVIVACWLLVAFLLLRMAWGGSIGGIIYVIGVTHPILLAAGLVTIVGAIVVSYLLLSGATSSGLTASVALGILAVPLSVILIPDHGSAPVVTVASLLALALSARARFRAAIPTSSEG